MRIWISLMLFIGFASVTSAKVIELRTSLQDSEPKYLVKEVPGGEPQVSGICVEIMRAIEKADPEIRFAFWHKQVPFKRIEQALTEGKNDVFFGMIKNEERAAKFIFVDPPLYSTYNKMVVRAEETANIQSLQDLLALGEEGRVLVDAGTAHVKFLQTQPGLIIDEGGKTREDNLKKLLLKRARFYYSTDLGITYYVKTMGLQNQVKLLPHVFKVDAQYLAFAKTVDAAVVARVTKTLEKLQASGELQRIRDQY
jgi:glutamate/aspartate transport system substrate-binding protein